MSGNGDRMLGGSGKDSAAGKWEVLAILSALLRISPAYQQIHAVWILLISATTRPETGIGERQLMFDGNKSFPHWLKRSSFVSESYAYVIPGLVLPWHFN